MLERATRLCDAPCAILWTYDGEAFSVPATFGVPEAFAEYLRKPLEIRPSVFLRTLRHGETFVHNLDLADTDSYRGGNPLNRAVVDLGGARTGLLVPLQKDGRFLGAFRIYRDEVRPFHRQADRSATKFRPAGGHSDGERAADHRDPRSPGAADRDCGGIGGHQFLARRPRAGVR